MFRRGFRPFFLGVAVHATLIIPLWVAVWLGGLPAPGWLAPVHWHAHEMLFGTVAAAIAGFLLTSAPVWSGRPALVGAPLAGLFALWVSGRVAMAIGGPSAAGLLAAIDGLFLPVLWLVLARTLWGREHRRNHGILLLVGGLALANAAVHADALGVAPGWAPRALRLATDVIVVLLVVIGGRITPAFTANAFRRAGVPAEVRGHPGLDGLAIGTTLAVAIAHLIAPASAAGGVLACVAGVSVAARMGGWQTRRTGGDPLLWSLHAGLLWVAVGLLLVGAGDLGLVHAGTAGLHALTAGAMGSMILAVMTRVGLGHTGRPLVLPRGAVLGYALVHAAALARVVAGFRPDLTVPLLIAAAGLWASAFAVFGVLYAPILCGSRADGKPG